MYNGALIDQVFNNQLDFNLSDLLLTRAKDKFIKLQLVSCKSDVIFFFRVDELNNFLLYMFLLPS